MIGYAVPELEVLVTEAKEAGGVNTRCGGPEVAISGNNGLVLKQSACSTR
jgi:hypothetical protein